MNRRTFYRLIPLLLLTAFILVINMGPRLLASLSRFAAVEATAVTGTPPANPAPAGAELTTPPLPTTTPSATPSPAPTPTATLPPDAAITLLGPPPDGRFRQGEPVTFYWLWPLPLLETQVFNLYWLREGEALLLGSLAAPNLGPTGYRLTASLPQSGTFSWQVRLETAVTTQPLLSSDIRSLAILPPLDEP